MTYENILSWIMFFYIYSMLGWIFESCYVSLKEKKWINRGFLHGPFLPIYGSGAVMMLYVSQPFQDNLILTYIAGMIGATALELATGWAIECIFKVRYWDYSYQRFHFKGYICLSSSIAWGFFTILMNKVLHPFILDGLQLIPMSVIEVIFCVVSIHLLIDSFISINEALAMRNMILSMENMRKEVYRMKRRADVILAFMDADIHEFVESHPDIERMDNFIKDMEDTLIMIKENSALFQRMNQKMKSDYAVCRHRIEKIKKASEDYKQRLKKRHIRRIQSNPGMISHKHREAWETLKESYRRL